MDREQTGFVRIGVDLGGTKIEVAALGSDGGYLSRLRAPTPKPYADAIDTIRELIIYTEAAIGARGAVGVGAPGSSPWNRPASTSSRPGC